MNAIVSHLWFWGCSCIHRWSLFSQRVLMEPFLPRVQNTAANDHMRHTASHRHLIPGSSDEWLLVMTWSRACYKPVQWYRTCDWGLQTVLIDQMCGVSCWSTGFQYKSETCFNATYSTFLLFQLILKNQKYKDFTISYILAFVNALAIILFFCLVLIL